jgi:hypothetical protein
MLYSARKEVPMGRVDFGKIMAKIKKGYSFIAVTP